MLPEMTSVRERMMPERSTNRRLSAIAAAGFVAILAGCSGEEDGVGGHSAVAALTPVAITELLTASAIVDVNGDGKNDVFLAQSALAASDVVLLNDGNGRSFTTRSLPPRYHGVNSQTVAFEPGDFNEDGKVDVLAITAANDYNSARIHLYLGQGNGTFVDASASITAGIWPMPEQYRAPGGLVGEWPLWLRVVDIDGDGHLDFVAAAFGGGGYIYRNDGTGKFAPVSMALTDGSNSGTFKALAWGALGSGSALTPNANDVLVGDLNQDGKPDLFAPHGWNVHPAFLNTSTPGVISFTIVYSPGTSPMLNGMLLDIDGDHVLDVVGSPFNGTINPIPVVAFLGNGAGVFTENNTVFAPVQPGQVWQRQYVTADFDDDGKQDLFIADTGWDYYPFPGARNWLLMNENGVLVDKTQTNLSLLPGYTHGASVGDLNGDCRVDLILNNFHQTSYQSAAPEARFWLNDGTGKFTSYNPVIHR
jgi:hypothetical protein